MRKSNWIIAAVLLLASVAFLWIWHALQFDLVDNPLDIVVTVVWWVVIVAACVAILSMSACSSSSSTSIVSSVAPSPSPAAIESAE